MNIKASFKYQFNDTKRSICIYYLVIVLVIALLGVTSATYLAGETSNGYFQISMVTAIFLFVAGLNSFKENFGMLAQNGISRKSLIAGNLVLSVTISIITALVDKVLYLIVSQVSKLFTYQMNYTTIHEQLYPNVLNNGGAVLYQISGIFLDFLIYLLAFSFGYLLTVLFYRLNKIGKIMVSVGIPAFISFGLPIIEIISRHSFSKFMIKIGDFIMGLSDQAPIRMMITCFVAFLIISGCTWLLVRRAPVKEV